MKGSESASNLCVCRHIKLHSFTKIGQFLKKKIPKNVSFGNLTKHKITAVRNCRNFLGNFLLDSECLCPYTTEPSPGCRHGLPRPNRRHGLRCLGRLKLEGHCRDGRPVRSTPSALAPAPGRAARRPAAPGSKAARDSGHDGLSTGSLRALAADPGPGQSAHDSD